MQVVTNAEVISIKEYSEDLREYIIKPEKYRRFELPPRNLKNTETRRFWNILSKKYCWYFPFRNRNCYE